MQDPYCYHETDILKNKFNIRDKIKLSTAERAYSNVRIVSLLKYPIKGDFDFKHLQNIHKFIFQDIYDWAGEIRNVEISKGLPFCYSYNIPNESERIFNGIQKENYLKHLKIDKFSDRLAYYAAEINALHPFREGNGRSTREFIRSLAKNAGYTIDYSKMDTKLLFNAFVISFTKDYYDLRDLFKENISRAHKNKNKNYDREL
ncbi:MAG: Fic family protein [Clostridium sp.]|nr:Fic family protein [Clostridium sp.]